MNSLVLNSDWRPLSIISAKRAVILDINNQNITALSYYANTIESINERFKVPAVLLYSKYVRFRRNNSPTKANIRNRDRNKCAYCECVLTDNIFTIDHIIPISRFTNKSLANTWENKVACCKKCNNKKGNRTPEEAKMLLKVKPRRVYGILIGNSAPDEWKKYIN
jgi:5-methylcytosine-specific restriction endonuclease McrA